MNLYVANWVKKDGTIKSKHLKSKKTYKVGDEICFFDGKDVAGMIVSENGETNYWYIPFIKGKIHLCNNVQNNSLILVKFKSNCPSYTYVGPDTINIGDLVAVPTGKDNSISVATVVNTAELGNSNVDGFFKLVYGIVVKDFV